MSAKIFAFPRLAAAPSVPAIAGAPPFSPAWCEHHLPLVQAAMDLLAADDVEFARRCDVVADADGIEMLAGLASQIDRLGSCIDTVAEALTTTALRIRTTIDQRQEELA